MNSFSEFRLMNYIFVVCFSLFLVGCSSEEEPASSSEVALEEVSEIASELAEEMAESIEETTEETYEFPLNKDQLPEVLMALEANAIIQENYNACPIKIFQKYRKYENHALINHSYEKQCADDPAGCLKACLEDNNGPLCQDFAYVLEDHEQEIGARFGQMMYAQACAAGWPLSCTNRGAGIRNALAEEDPFFSISEDETNICLNTTFEKMCDEKESWGCYMTGVSFSEGEGRDIDEAKAAEYYKRACDTDPDSGACFQ